MRPFNYNRNLRTSAMMFTFPNSNRVITSELYNVSQTSQNRGPSPEVRRDSDDIE